MPITIDDRRWRSNCFQGAVGRPATQGSAPHRDREGIDQGACGACTVLVDGERNVSCLALASRDDGRKVRIEVSNGARATVTGLRSLQRWLEARHYFSLRWPEPSQTGAGQPPFFVHR